MKIKQALGVGWVLLGFLVFGSTTTNPKPASPQLIYSKIKAPIISSKEAPSELWPLDESSVVGYAQMLNFQILFSQKGFSIVIPKPASKSSNPSFPPDKDHDEKSLSTVPSHFLWQFENHMASKKPFEYQFGKLGSTRIHWLKGQKESWKQNLPTYESLNLKQIWQGISCRFEPYLNHMTMTFDLLPGNDPSLIEINLGADLILMKANGDLRIKKDGLDFILSKPMAFQNQNGQSVQVEAQYRILGEGHIGLMVSGYDPHQRLLISPDLKWSTFFGGGGGGGNDTCQKIAQDGSGYIYLSGNVSADDFPTTAGVYNDHFIGGPSDIYIAKLDPGTMSLVYSTIIGGTGEDTSTDLAVDGSGKVFLVGQTSSSDFPTSIGAYDSSFHSAPDTVILKLTIDGSSLEFSTYLGGNDMDNGVAVALDTGGNPVVVGRTQSTDFPSTPGSYDNSYNGTGDCFITKLNSTGTALLFSTFLGSNQVDVGLDVAIDSADDIFVCGDTQSTTFPVTAGSFDITHNGYRDGFLSKLSADGTSLIFSTFFGGSSYETIKSLVVTSGGKIVVTGDTLSSDFPTTSGAYNETIAGAYDAFVTEFKSDGGSLEFSTFIGGSGSDFPKVIALDSHDKFYIAGETTSTDFPTTAGVFGSTPSYVGDVFICKLNGSGSSLDYSTLLGGNSGDYLTSMTIDGDDQAWVTGYTNSTDFPTTANALSEELSGYADGFVCQIDATASSVLYCTYLGGSNEDRINSLAVDPSGNLYVTGRTFSSTFPTTTGAFSEQAVGSYDAFIGKLSPSGDSLIYATFLGGTGYDEGFDIAVDGNGNAYVVGDSVSSDFPTTPGAPDTTNDAFGDMFISKLSADGTTLTYSTLLGGSDLEEGYSIAVNSAGEAVVTGYTYSSDYPTTSGTLSEALQGYSDAPLTKLSANGQSFIFSTFLGGTEDEEGHVLTYDSVGNIAVSGITWSTDFPTSPSAYDTTYNGSGDVFVSLINPTGTSIVSSTFLGGSSQDNPLGLTVASNGDFYVCGTTYSNDFPATSGSFSGGSADGFAAKLSSNATALGYSTYLGGSGLDSMTGIQLDAFGNAFIAGHTGSSDFPTTASAQDTTFNGSIDAVLCLLSQDGSQLGYSTYFGGAYLDKANRMILGADGNPVIAGETYSQDLPTTAGALDQTINGYGDGFVAAFDFSFDASVTPSIQVLGLTLPMLTASESGSLNGSQIAWSANPPTSLVPAGATVTLNPAPTSTTLMTVEITDGMDRIATDQGLVLVAADPIFRDLNQDGCNNLEDLWNLMEYWNQLYPGDPDSDGRITVLDALYINLDDPYPCP